MAINSSTRFGVVYSTPKDFIEKISSKDSAYTNGKLFVLHGDAQGALTQGIYMVEQNDADPDGSLNIQMLSSGTYASSTNAGLMSAADVATLSNALSKTDASNTYLKINDASFFRTVAVKNGNTTTNIVADSSRDTLTISAGSNIKLTGNASNDTLTIEATDTTYSGTAPINVSGTAISHAASGVTAGRYGDVDTSTGRTLEFGGKFKVVDISVNTFGHVTSAISRELTLPSKPATAGTADEAKKTTGTLTIKGNGTSVGTFNGSAAEEVNIKTGNASTLTITGTNDGSITITPVTAAVASNSSALTTGAQVATYVSTQLGNLAGALLYQGTVSTAAELNAKAKTQGHVWISSSKGWEYTDVNNQKYKIEVGDMFICNGTGWNIVSSEFDVSANADGTELSVGGTKTVATVDGVDINVSLPDKGDNVYYEHPVAGKPTQSLGNAAKNTTVTIGTETKIATVYDVSFDASGHYKGKVARDISINITSNNTDEKVKAATSAGKFYLIGQDDATSGTTETTYKNASVYVDGSALYSEGKKVLTGYTEKYTGTVTSIAPGTGLTNGTTENAITSTGTLNLKIASSGEIGGVKPGTTNGKTYGVQVNASTGEMTVDVPWSNDDTKDTAGSYDKTGTKLLLVGATSTTTGKTYTNSNVYINTSNQIIAPSGTITSGNIALVTGGTVYTAIENAIEAATIYWETL